VASSQPEVLDPTHGSTGGDAAGADGSLLGGSELRTILVGWSALRRRPIPSRRRIFHFTKLTL
jgi:hypothetical protein